MLKFQIFFDRACCKIFFLCCKIISLLKIWATLPFLVSKKDFDFSLHSLYKDHLQLFDNKFGIIHKLDRSVGWRIWELLHDVPNL